MAKFYQLDQDAQTALTLLVGKAMASLRVVSSQNADLLADLYSNRSIGGASILSMIPEGGIATTDVPNIQMPGITRYMPQTSVNLLNSRLKQIVISITPGRPTFITEPLNDLGLALAEEQEEIFHTVLPQSGMDTAFERLAYLLPTQSYFGLKLIPEKDNPQWQAIEADYCGYEPHGRRFSWHSFSKQFGDLDLDVQEMVEEKYNKVLQDWDMVDVTEVYHQALDVGHTATGNQAPMSLYVNPAGNLWGERNKNKKPKLGVYVGTTNLTAPVLIVDRALPPAPNEDIAPAEVVSWLPLVTDINTIVTRIVEEAEAINTTIVYDSHAIDQTLIDAMKRASKGGRRVFVPVDTSQTERGVDSTMRPIERSPVIQEYIATLNTLIALLDEVTGVGAVDRGIATNPEKSATEAAALVGSANKRNADRLRIMSRTWSAGAYIFMLWQRKMFGTTIKTPTGGDMLRTISVPDPRKAAMGVRVDPVALANLSQEGRLEVNMTAFTMLSNHFAQFQDPNARRMLGEGLRRVLKSLGWHDTDQYFRLDSQTDGALERYLMFLQTGQSMPVYADDQHQVYISDYSRILEKDGADQVALLDVIQQHELILTEQAAQVQNAAPQSPIPGMSAEGGIDNQIAADIAAGEPPTQTPQTIG